MKWLVRRFRKLSIRDKYTYSSILLFVLSFLVINFAYSVGFSSIMEKQISKYTAKNLDQANSLIDEKLSAIEYLTDILSRDSSIQRVLKHAGEGKTPSERYEDFLAIESIYDTFVYYNKESISLLVLDGQGEIYKLGGAYDIDLSQYSQSAWYQNALRMQGGISWNGVRKASYTNYGQEVYFLSLSRTIIDHTTGEPLGVVLIEINENVLFEILQQVNMDSSSEVLIVDKGGNIISHSDRGKMSQYYNNQTPIAFDTGAGSGYYLETKGRENRLIVYFTSELTGWRFIHTIPTKVLLSQMASVKRYNVLVLVLACMVVTVISFFISRSLVNPLVRFKGVVESINDENLDAKIHISSEDEVGFLAAAFNKMIDRIGQLVKQVRKEEAEKRELEIKFLQNQINPHFIYNTLESIRMICEINNYDKATKMLFLMGRLLRYGLSRKESLVTIEDEIRNIQDYISLMEYSYADHFEVEYHLDETVLHAQIPKLTLQPIVENSIFHGLSCMEGAGLISIHAIAEDGMAKVSIVDNGEGFEMAPDDYFETIAKRAAQGEKQTSGIGLYNINTRIQLYYGQAYGLQIESQPGEYTKVTVNLPLRQDGALPE